MTTYRKYLPDGDYVVLPDLQIPSHDGKALKAVCDFIADFQPKGVLNVGDESDSPEPARWNKGQAEEYIGTFWENALLTNRIMQQIDDALRMRRGDVADPVTDLEHHVMRSNHGDRVLNYLRKYAPALEGKGSPLTIPRIFGYNDSPIVNGADPLPIHWHDRLWEFAPGWVLAHGDEGSLIRTAGGTALNIAKRIGASVICGHTHKAGVQHHTSGFNHRDTQRLVGVEVGHLMDMRKAGYLKGGHANWQQAFAILTIHKRKVHPRLVLFHGKSFAVEGQVYSW